MSQKVLRNRWVLFGIAAIVMATIVMAWANIIKNREIDKKVLSYVKLGHDYSLKGDVDKAYESYQNAWNLKPRVTNSDERNAAINLAQIKMSKGDMEGARSLLLKTIKYDPFFYPSYLFLGDTYLSAKQIDKAFFYFEKGLSLKDYFIKDDPNAALLYYNMAETLMLKGDKDGARMYLENFLSIAGDDKRLEGTVAKAEERIKALK